MRQTLYLPLGQRVSRLPVNWVLLLQVFCLNKFDSWGVPGHQLTATAYALISLGEKAIDVLKPLLVDQRPAPLSGSKNATASAVYGNRLCDYCWVFISEIRHQPYIYARDPIERDHAIATLQQELQDKAG